MAARIPASWQAQLGPPLTPQPPSYPCWAFIRRMRPIVRLRGALALAVLLSLATSSAEAVVGDVRDGTEHHESVAAALEHGAVQGLEHQHLGESGSPDGSGAPAQIPMGEHHAPRSPFRHVEFPCRRQPPLRSLPGGVSPLQRPCSTIPRRVTNRGRTGQCPTSSRVPRWTT